MSRNAPDAFRDSQPAAVAPRYPGGAAATIFVALTDDATLREAIDAAVASRGSALTTATPEAFADALVTHAGCIGIVDFASISGSGPEFVERLRGQFPGLVLVAAGSSRDQAALAPLVADGSVCRFAHKPVSGQRLGLFLDAALRRRDALAHEQRQVLLSPLRPMRPRASRIVLLILLLAAATGGALWLLRSPEARPSSAALPAIEPAVAATFPPIVIPGDIALAAPLQAAALPDIRTDNGAAARREAQAALRLMDVGLLIDPPGNNARSHVAAALRLAPEDAEVHRAARALSGRLVTATRNALLAHDVAGAQRLLDATRSYGVNAATVAELDGQLDMLKGLMSQ